MVRQLRARLIAAVVLALALTAGACGNDGGSGNGTGSGDTSKGEPTEAQAKAALLASSDFPAGWQGQPSEGEDAENSDDDEICDEINTDDEVEPSVEADAEFAAAETGPFVLHAVAIYDDEDEASRVMDLLNEAFEKCKEFTDTDEEIGELKGTFTKTSSEDLGDEALAATIAATGTGLSMSGDLIVVRKGRGMFMLMQFGVEVPGFGGGPRQEGLTAQLAAKALAKLEAADA